MQITIKREGETLRAALCGELDHHSAAQTRESLDRLIAQYRDTDLVLDLKNLSFMDSSGIGVILGRYRRMRNRGGRVRISVMSTYAARILKMAGILTLLGEGEGQREGKRGSRKDV